MARKAPPVSTMPPSWPRADPAELASFSMGSKVCTMNCGPSRDDPRTEAERRLLCGDCVPALDVHCGRTEPAA